MKKKNSRIVSLIMPLVWAALMVPLDAFVVGVNQHTVRSSLSTVFYMNDEDNEWYTPPPPKPQQKAPAPAETVVESSEDLRSFLSGQKTDGRLTIVTYHAAWCRSCARFNLHFNKVKQEYAGSRDGNQGLVRFASVEFGSNAAVCAEQSVTRLPTTRLYYKNKLVQEFSKGASEITRVQDAIKYYVSKWKRDERKALAETLQSGNELVSDVMAEERIESSSLPAATAASD